MKRSLRRWGLLVLGLLVVLPVLLMASEAAARVGGGESFGGGGSGGGGGGGGDGDLIIWAVYLAIRYPVIGVPLLILVVGGMIYKNHMKTKKALPASTQNNLNRMLSGAPARRRAKVKSQIDKLLEDDPNFSEILFLDFAQMIYTRFQEARGSSELTGLRPYLSEELIERLERVGQQLAKGAFAVERVVVGAISVDNVVAMSDHWRLSCDVEANYTEKSDFEGQAREQSYFSRSRMYFRRAQGVLSKGPDQIRTLGCPSCGSPIKLDAENICAYCGNPAEPGIFHWELVDLEETARMHRREAPLALGGVEVGTNFPTVFDPDLDVNSKAFLMRYPGESLNHLSERAERVFLALQDAWSSGKWEEARAYETDRLYQMHLFWMDRYASRGLRNVLEQIQVVDTTLVKIDRDAFLELATLRIKASMLDYTIDRNGKVVGGSKSKPRVFSEYWTFVRQAGFEPGQEKDAGTCPSCGAPVKVSMNGRCDYCDANLSSGEFDWTLAKIEQDESYAG